MTHIERADTMNETDALRAILYHINSSGYDPHNDFLTVAMKHPIETANALKIDVYEREIARMAATSKIAAIKKVRSDKGMLLRDGLAYVEAAMEKYPDV